MRPIRLILPALSIVIVLTTGCSVDTAEETTTNLYDRVAATAEEARPLMPGLRAPSFEIPMPDGSLYTFDSENLDQPAVIIFYRGGWCPWCNRQLSGLRTAQQELINLGYEVLFISADQEDVLKPSLEVEGIDYMLLSDNEMEVARDYGLAFRVSEETVERYAKAGIDLEAASGYDHHILPVPATFVIGLDGMIQFVYANPNYRVRVNPELLVMAARLAVEDS
ncbi:MAG: peroxiredoxin-like family protein [Rhodothermia bacterium]|nr:MAG: peroxiredoxin-like family protein [Rhodothermia bacterium]